MSERLVSQLDPREIGALVTLVNQDRSSEAEQRARALLALHPDDGMLWKILGVALLRQRKDALQALRRAAELIPEDAEAHGNLGAALYERGQWAEALLSLRRVLELQPDNVEALVDCANALKAHGNAHEAIALYHRALRLKPQLVEAQNNLGNAYLEAGQTADAVGYYRLALIAKPDDPQILCNLGNALRQLGHIDEAVASSSRAIALDPTLSVAHNNLGLILAARGYREQAMTCYRQALSLNPLYVEALNNLGNVVRDLGGRREAASLYARAVELDPRRADSHCNLGNALLELRRVDAAEASFRRALALEPNQPLALTSLATVLRVQHRAAEAQASCQAALAIDPDHVEALSLLGELRADRGQFSEAEQLFERAAALQPDFPFAFFSIAAHRKMRLDDTAWLKGAQALLAKSLPLRHETNLHYALGKYFDDVGRYRDAFEHYARANELAKRFGSNYQAANLTRRIDGIISGFDAEFIQRAKSQGSASELPIFIVGMPRSGTSLTEQILASHPAVFGAGELTFWNRAFVAYKDAEAKGNAGAGLIAAIGNSYLERLKALSGDALRIVDKMPSNFMYLGMIHAAFPKARIIHMQRHPIDTCLSIYFQNFFHRNPYANDLEHLAHYYGQYRRITDHWRAVLPESALLEVPYEGLIEDQEGWTRRMLDFVGLPWDRACLDFHQTDRVVITSSKWQVRQKIYSASAGRFKNYQEFLGPLQRLAGLPARP
jgi:tetratricopeptide (TPR) repeat protein